MHLKFLMSDALTTSKLEGRSTLRSTKYPLAKLPIRIQAAWQASKQECSRLVVAVVSSQQFSGNPFILPDFSVAPTVTPCPEVL